MRNLYDVIQRMIAEIPAENETLIYELRSISERWLWAPPETWHELWRATSRVLDKYLGDDLKQSWELNIFNIFMGTNLENS